ncbi:hypothetical protein Y11_p0981 (plasmid) [Yersinia enterocolitica subsp. palearctica Y11]|uniref:Uncharacterized protein n=1 Tax=Yersinia enterocolitica subsp. palearctica serotype O:3 (strain DSM 13030 / CIP 106945 / Y11) TaxID=930944 RepID=A0A0H3NWE5_YERE1|nr:hypothetical protein Y11_p0981 [Yersinia enterocolitica subsp. palearctica Y11]
MNVKAIATPPLIKKTKKYPSIKQQLSLSNIIDMSYQM